MRARRIILPGLLAVAAVACVTVALRLDAAAATDRSALSERSLATPVLSARRLPGWVAAPVAQRRLQADLEAWAAYSPPQSCLVVHDSKGRELFAHQPTLPVVPASTEKLVTATAALRALGGDHRFVTRVVTSAPAGPVLAADLVLVGGGDPGLASPDHIAASAEDPPVATNLDALAAEVVASGVRRVEGAVVGDESRYDQQRYVPGWPQRYLDQVAIGPMSALTVNDGREPDPAAPPGAPAPPVIAVDPARGAAAVFTRLLEARGVDVVGEPRAGPAAANSREVASVESRPLAEIVDMMLRESDNMTAELLVKAIGLDEALNGSTAGGAEAMRSLQGSAASEGTVVADGSGLALQNRVTCAQLVGLLLDPDVGDDLIDGLAVAGESGTLERRYVDTALAGKLRAKTGTLRSVTALAGVLDDTDGRLVFAYVGNVAEDQTIPAELVAAQEQLGEILLSWPRHPDVTALRPLPPAP